MYTAVQENAIENVHNPLPIELPHISKCAVWYIANMYDSVKEYVRCGLTSHRDPRPDSHHLLPSVPYSTRCDGSCDGSRPRHDMNPGVIIHSLQHNNQINILFMIPLYITSIEFFRTCHNTKLSHFVTSAFSSIVHEC